MNGSVQLFHDEPIRGPYKQEWRERWLSKLLEAQTWIRDNGPTNVGKIELVSLAELEEIRRIWVVDKHEFEDNLPRIYETAVGQPYPGKPMDNHLALGPQDIALLRELSDGDELHFELVRELLDIEQRHRSMTRRAGLFDTLEQSLKRGFYTDADDAVARVNLRRDTPRELTEKYNLDLDLEFTRELTADSIETEGVGTP